MLAILFLDQQKTWFGDSLALLSAVPSMTRQDRQNLGINAAIKLAFNFFAIKKSKNMKITE